MGNQITSVFTKQLFVLHQRQLKHLFIFVLILALVILATLSPTFKNTVTYRTETTDGQQKSDEEADKMAQVNQEPDEGENIYQIRNQKIREVCKKVKTTRPLFVNNRQAKVPLSYWLKNWTALTPGKIFYINLLIILFFLKL